MLHWLDVETPDGIPLFVRMIRAAKVATATYEKLSAARLRHLPNAEAMVGGMAMLQLLGHATPAGIGALGTHPDTRFFQPHKAAYLLAADFLKRIGAAPNLAAVAGAARGVPAHPSLSRLRDHPRLMGLADPAWRATRTEALDWILAQNPGLDAALRAPHDARRAMTLAGLLELAATGGAFTDEHPGPPGETSGKFHDDIDNAARPQLYLVEGPEDGERARRVLAHLVARHGLDGVHHGLPRGLVDDDGVRYLDLMGKAVRLDIGDPALTRVLARLGEYEITAVHFSPTPMPPERRHEMIAAYTGDRDGIDQPFPHGFPLITRSEFPDERDRGSGRADSSMRQYEVAENDL
ncbi:hypothetical protein Afil01_25190 [Actinorhabdospora filicis]|uniref:Uncharacterized protein n=1 Tax=Actinorhabdospora filicis TaxID=1785913 RepID=A0A9W6SKQ2_9ACTN|nr:hypothetical protein Afil01_25190 [Actinorhabdospora filicis]